MKTFLLTLLALTPASVLAHTGEESGSYGMHDMWNGSGMMGFFGWTFMILAWVLIALAIVSLIIWITKNTKK